MYRVATDIRLANSKIGKTVKVIEKMSAGFFLCDY